ncbi:mechanosensitive ion channel domain-containing protein [Dongia sp.]|uniref:mechanosensitive ion channel domain-containing protein n=1 Tax=Dongia sp. TaxID=1977262 RepID=UPI0035AEA5D8
MLRRLLILLGLAAVIFAAAPAVAQSTDTVTPPQVQELLRLLDDPVIRDWVAQQKAPAQAAQATEEMSPSGYVDRRLADIRQHIDNLVMTVPNLPAEFDRAGDILMVEFQDRGIAQVLSLIFGFLALGFLVEWLFRRATQGLQRWIVGVPLNTVGERLRAAGIRLSFGLGLVVAFAVGSVGAFLAFTWPPLLREIVLGYLTAFLVLRITLVVSRFTLAPGGERFRLVPMKTEAAWFWYRRIALAVGWLAIGWVSVGLLGTLGLSFSSRVLIAYVLGLILLAIGIEAVWRRPAALLQAAGDNLREGHHEGRGLTNWLLTAYFTLLWLLWVASAMPTFWMAVALVGLPTAIRGVRHAVNHVLRPAGAAMAQGSAPSVTEVCLERGLRALLIIAAALLLAKAWHIDLVAMTMRDNLTTRLVRGLLSAVVIALIAEFAWHFTRAVIDAKMSGGQASAHADSEDMRRQARLRTLLPILRNILFVVILVIAVLMILSSMGVEIGPLIAGAGVVGVAVGFGAQTLVKDVISGMFFLLDDAFRIGEYIQSGSYKGTVESFSLRSVKLRHHRGPLYTVPFGELGAVQNMSRDWVIDKMTIGVTYDSDLEKARKLIKDVGKELAANPEYAPFIIEPLKMQGVEQFGDYAIQIRMKMMTKPGEQFVIRRKALALIRKAFNENGISFAQPTVQVAGGAEHVPSVAAKQVLDLAASNASANADG